MWKHVKNKQFTSWPEAKQKVRGRTDLFSKHKDKQTSNQQGSRGHQAGTGYIMLSHPSHSGLLLFLILVLMKSTCSCIRAGIQGLDLEGSEDVVAVLTSLPSRCKALTGHLLGLRIGRDTATSSADGNHEVSGSLRYSRDFPEAICVLLQESGPSTKGSNLVLVKGSGSLKIDLVGGFRSMGHVLQDTMRHWSLSLFTLALRQTVSFPTSVLPGQWAPKTM